MRNYELMVVFPLEEDKFKELSDELRVCVNESGGKIESEEPFGDRDLAYEVKKHKRGRYVLFNISSPAEKVIEIDRRLKLVQGILTWLIVRKDEK